MACGGGSGSATPTATAPPAPTAAPTATASGPGPAQPDAERILDHIRFLTEEIGPRSAGSPQEGLAVAYAREQFEAAGYIVEVQSFAVERPDILRPAMVTTGEEEPRELTAVSFSGSGAGEVRGALLDAGTGREEDFPPDAEGGVLLIQRQDVFFVDMAQRALAAGAGAVVVANAGPDVFIGQIDPPAALSMVAISQGDGEALRTLLAAGPLEVSVRVEERGGVTARNVIARPATGECQTLSGGHFDSVPWTVGANDNASGSALVLELARAAAAAGLSGHCFALFGGEELGLLGSAFYITALTAPERDALAVMFNYDVVGSAGGVLAIGSQRLLDQAAAAADAVGVSVRLSGQVEDIGSDHRSFLDAGIPALMLTAPEFDLIHTISDTLAIIDREALATVGSLAFALLSGAEGSP